MIPSIPHSRLFRTSYASYVVLFFIFLAAPLVVVGTFAFNDSLFPSMPWKGATLDWFFGDSQPQLGLFQDAPILKSILVSFFIATCTTVLSLVLATCNAFLFEREQFPGKNLLYILMLMPLVIPGVILGVSILVFSSSIANWFEMNLGWDLDFLYPSTTLVILGQFAFISTICTLIVSARLRKFDLSLEEAALNLGATKLGAIRTITLPYLKPALIGAGIVSFLMSFENFNTTLMLVGSDAPLTIAMFDRLREGATPVLNAISLMLMVGSSVLAVFSLLVDKKSAAK